MLNRGIDPGRLREELECAIRTCTHAHKWAPVKGEIERFTCACGAELTGMLVR
jgi:hypothetical protein